MANIRYLKKIFADDFYKRFNYDIGDNMDIRYSQKAYTSV